MRWSNTGRSERDLPIKAAQAADVRAATAGATAGAAAPTTAAPAAPNARRSARVEDAVQPGRVTWRAMLLGLALSVLVAAVNCWISVLYNVFFLGGIQMPFASVFVLLALVLVVNGPLRWLQRSVPVISRVLPPFSSVELLTIYCMTLFAALVSTPGADNFFLTAAPTLFYLSTRENGWADLFYQYVPAHFAPGWNGRTFEHQVIEPLYNGGLSFGQIPWHAWAVMLIAWSVFLLLTYGMLFFCALAMRKQWVENEALVFPLVVLPLQMVEVTLDGRAARPGAFWGDKGMWMGFAIAAALHALRGLNSFYPDAPVASVNQINPVWFVLTEAPWNAAGAFKAELFLGGIGVAFLLTREVSLSFWFFFLSVMLEKVAVTQLGFPTLSMPADTSQGQPIFITFQAVGGWVMMALMLLWTAREHLSGLARAAFGVGSSSAASGRDSHEDEPFSPRVIVLGFVACLAGLLAWCAFSGINLLYAGAFLVIYLGASLVIARLVVEGGFLFPQIPFSPLEWMTTAMFSTQAVGAANLTRLSFLQPPLLSDMRTSVLPAFLHTLKIAGDLKLGRAATRRLLGACLAAVALAFGTTIVVSLYALYSRGGLTGYSWFAYVGPQTMFNGTAGALRGGQGFEAQRVGWIALGAGVVYLLMAARARVLWFPLHPLGYIVASGYPMTRLWFSFFIGWLVKSLVMRFGGEDAAAPVRPFMIGLIFGNLSAMVFWAILSLIYGQAIAYWPA